MSCDDLFNLSEDFDVYHVTSPNDANYRLKSQEEITDVFSGLDFDCPSELNSPSDSDSRQSESFEKPIRKQLVIGRHIRINPDGSHKFTCTICNSKFSRKQQIRYHDYCVTGKRPLKCDLCGKGFVKKSHLIYHVRTHTGESPYTCKICQKGFKQKAKLKRHERTHNRGEDSRLVCMKCKKSYSDKDSLKKHEQKHALKDSFHCSSCEKSYADKFTLKQHMEIHNNPGFICEVCGKSFVRRNSLNVHMQIHEDVYPFECDSCHKTFRSKKELGQHSIVHDQNNPGHECKICNITCGRRDNLLRHIRNCHLDPCQKKSLKDSKGTSATERRNGRKSIEEINREENLPSDLTEKQDSFGEVVQDSNSGLKPQHDEAINLEQNHSVKDKKAVSKKPAATLKCNGANTTVSSRLIVKLFPPKSKKRKIDGKSATPKEKILFESSNSSNKDNSKYNENLLKTSAKKSTLIEKNCGVEDKCFSDPSLDYNKRKKSVNRPKDVDSTNAKTKGNLNIQNLVTTNSKKIPNVDHHDIVSNEIVAENDAKSSCDVLFNVSTVNLCKELNSPLARTQVAALKRTSVLVPSLINERQVEDPPILNDSEINEIHILGNSSNSNVGNVEFDKTLSEQSLVSPKTSVIVHTDKFKSLLLEANASREPVIKYSRSTTTYKETDRKALHSREPP